MYHSFITINDTPSNIVYINIITKTNNSNSVTNKCNLKHNTYQQNLLPFHRSPELFVVSIYIYEFPCICTYACVYSFIHDENYTQLKYIIDDNNINEDAERSDSDDDVSKNGDKSDADYNTSDVENISDTVIT